MKPLQSGARAGICLGLLLLFSGCVDRTESGDAVSYSYAMWVPFMCVGVAAGLGLVGWKMHKDTGSRFQHKGMAYVLVAAGLLVGVAPTTLMNHVKMDSERLDARLGMMWFWMDRCDVAWADIGSISLSNERRHPKGSDQTMMWVIKIQTKDGTVHRLEEGGILKEAARDEILKTAREERVSVAE